MRSISSFFKVAKNSREKAPIWLYTVHEYNGVSDLTLAEHDIDITYNGVTYLATPMKHEEIAENSTGEIDTVRISISNVVRTVEAYLWNYDWSGLKVTLKLVWADRLDDEDAYLDFKFYIDSYSSNEVSADFVLSPRFDLLDIQLPLERYSRNYCRYRIFKGTACGYTGSESSCDRRKATCKAYGNIARFGGQPATPTRGVYV